MPPFRFRFWKLGSCLKYKSELRPNVIADRVDDRYALAEFFVFIARKTRETKNLNFSRLPRSASAARGGPHPGPRLLRH